MPFIRTELAQRITPVPDVNVVLSWEAVRKSIIQIPVSDGTEIETLLYQPTNRLAEGCPLLVIYHSGGWCTGRPEMAEVFCARAVQKFGVVALSVGYRLAPEHPFPTGVDDCWDALRWVAENATRLEADPRQGFLVGGESNGATAALVSVLRARDEGLAYPISGIWLAAPTGLAGDISASGEFSTETPFPDPRAMKYMQEKAMGNVNDQKFNPSLWSTGHKGLPNTYFQICGLDPQRDGCLRLKQILSECHTTTKADTYPGLSHAFWAVYPQLQVSRKAVQDTVQGIGWLLEKTSAIE